MAVAVKTAASGGSYPTCLQVVVLEKCVVGVGRKSSPSLVKENN